ncbi:MAG TPA: hypothetical protein VFI34_12250, partial [Candidatus Limnocylindrales bacterium]|nr:hypothetical protein [Candidatus Limnocylindrales bacterium]
MPRTSRLVHRFGSLVASTSIAVSVLAGGAAASPIGTLAADGACRLGPTNAVQHVIYVQFDNTHLRRDMPNVPSDLEQMPHLLDFMRNNGTLLSNDHTILISHTGGGILSSLTGVYPDRHGQTVSNSYVRTSSTGAFSFPSTFGYWTDPVSAANTPTVPNMVTPTGANAPAPWVPFTRAGCDFGAVGTANTVLENTGTGPNGDITKVFGNPSPQATEAMASAAAPSGTAARAKAQTDFVGYAVHCAQGSATCADGHPDLLPDEPGGYAGFNGLFGAQEIDPLLTGEPASTAVTGLDGQPITDPFGQPGFPGFDGMSAAVSLAYTAEMQEAGVPVTFAYISDAHDNHGIAGNTHIAYGPGSQGYVDQLKAYDDAFGAFFDRLSADGIDKSNTLFVFTVDEGDHFVGSEPANPDCDGITIACDWDSPQDGHPRVGELNANIATLVANQFPPALSAQFQGPTAPNAFTVHGDDAPTFYLAKKGAGGGALAQGDPLTRAFEREAAKLTAVDQYTGATDRLMVAMADQAEMKLLHMYTAGDPSRNAVFTYFGDADYFLTDFPASTCLTCINPLFAWNHGDIQPEIANTWLGFVGPGIRELGETATPWTDHTDVRPTMLAELGLADTYQFDGRPILEILDGNAVPHGFNVHRGKLQQLTAAYKQLTAPFGSVGLDSLAYNTAAIQTGSQADDSAYAAGQATLADWLTRRDALAGQIRDLLNGLATGGPSPSAATIGRLTA